jgi:hypothetical protein
VVLKHYAGSTSEDYAWLAIHVSLQFVGDDWLAFPNHPGLGFISGRLSVGLDPLSVSTFTVMMMKTGACRRKIPRLLPGGSPGQFARGLASIISLGIVITSSGVICGPDSILGSSALSRGGHGHKEGEGRGHGELREDHHPSRRVA